MSSCHFGAMCFLWVSLVVPSTPWLPCPWFFQQGSLSTPPMAAQPGDPQDCHHPMALTHKLLPCPPPARSHSSEPTWAHRRSPWRTREEFLFSSKICHLQKEILKLRVMSDLKKAEKWDWEEHVCCSWNLSAPRMQGGLGWVLKYYFKILAFRSWQF